MKIKRIKKIQKETEVYDLTVPELHNFVLESGIVVHNCAQAIYKSFQQVPLETSKEILEKTQKALDAVKYYEYQQMSEQVIQEQAKTDIGQLFNSPRISNTTITGMPNFYGIRGNLATSSRPNFYGR